MTRPAARIAEIGLRRPRTVLAVWGLVLVVGGFFALGLERSVVPGGEAANNSESSVVARELGHAPVPSLFAVVDGSPAAVGSVIREIRATPRVSGVITLRAAHGVVLSVSTTGGTDGAVKAASALRGKRAALSATGARVSIGGFAAYRDELSALSRSDLTRAERIGLPIVFVVLLLSFGTFAAAVLPIVLGASAVTVGLGVVGGLAHVLPISEYVTNAATMIGLALGVDYAMFLQQRFREEVTAGAQVVDAARATMRTTGVAVMWSAGTVLAAETTLLLVPSRAIRSAALGMILVTFLAAAAALILAPVLFVLFGKRLSRPRSSWARIPLMSSGWWHRWGQRVTGRAPLWLAAGLLLLVALGLPALRLSSSVNVQTTSSLPHNSSVRQAYDRVAAEFGPGASSPVLVLVDSEHASQVAHVVGADSHEVAATSTRAIGEGRSLVAVTGRSAPYTPEARALVENLRSGSLHRQLAGIDYQVGGETATSVDATAALYGSLPLITCLVLILVAAVLVGALRSVLLPIKAVVLVVLSLVATLGSLVLLTTTDFGSKLLGLGGPTDIQPFVPVTVVAIVLALSTDYEVILISRIREEFQKSGDNTASVVEGLARTGPVISSAGATMIAIFGSFALADLPVLKQLGVALALSVLLDAALVRGVLVPASMKLLGGRWNWWRPSLSLVRGRPLEEPT